MSAEAMGTAEEVAELQSTSGTKRSLVRGLLREPVGVVCVALLLIVIVAGLAAPLLAPFEATMTNPALTNAPPGTGEFLLGGDAAGRDVLSRLLWATRSTLLSCLIVLVVSVVTGVVPGLLAGYYAGRLETVTSWISDTILALPGMILLIALYSLIGSSIPLAMAVYGVMIAPSYYRLVRGVVSTVRAELFVDAAHVAGLSDARIIFKHVLTAVRAPVIIQSSFVLAAGIGIQAGLEFLGLGNPAEPSWGGMLQLAFRNLFINQSAVVWPAALITLVILALVLLGNSLRDVLQRGSRPAALTKRQRLRMILQLRAARQSDQAPNDVFEAELVRRPKNDPAPTSGNAAEALLSIRDLRVAFPGEAGNVNEVVRGVDLSVERGEIRGLVGESGSGKSQTVFAVLGILPPEALVIDGAIQFDGVDVLARPTAVRGTRIAYVPQEPMSNLDPTLTIGQQLTYGLRAVRPISRRAARVELLDLLGSVGIRDPQRVFDQYPHQISGGMAQRVLITGAIASDPELLVADEPTTALDVTVQAEVLDILRTLRNERGLGVLLVTHNLGVVADLCDTVTVMQSGEIVEQRTSMDLFANPQHPYTQALIAAARSGLDD